MVVLVHVSVVAAVFCFSCFPRLLVSSKLRELLRILVGLILLGSGK